MRYLLDTTVVSELGKSRPHPVVREWFDRADDPMLGLSVLVLGELRNGIERLRRRDPQQAATLERWLTTVEEGFRDRILGIDSLIAHAWGRLNAAAPLPTVDGLLAATALVHGLTVVTRDIAPFERVGVPWLDPWAYGQP